MGVCQLFTIYTMFLISKLSFTMVDFKITITLLRTHDMHCQSWHWAATLHICLSILFQLFCQLVNFYLKYSNTESIVSLLRTSPRLLYSKITRLTIHLFVLWYPETLKILISLGQSMSHGVVWYHNFFQGELIWHCIFTIWPCRGF